MTTPLALLPVVRSSVVRRAAEGQPCALRIASIFGASCASDRTTVLAHLPWMVGGMGTKGSDIHAVFSCSTCHDIIDRRIQTIRTAPQDAEVCERALLALAETQARLVEQGIIEVKGDRQ